MIDVDFCGQTLVGDFLHCGGRRGDATRAQRKPCDIALAKPIGTAELAMVTGALGAGTPLSPLQDVILNEMFGTDTPQARQIGANKATSALNHGGLEPRT